MKKNIIEHIELNNQYFVKHGIEHLTFDLQLLASVNIETKNNTNLEELNYAYKNPFFDEDEYNKYLFFPLIQSKEHLNQLFKGSNFKKITFSYLDRNLIWIIKIIWIKS